MDSSALQKVTEKSLSETAVISEVKDLAEKEKNKPAQVVNSKIGIDAERLRSSISKLTSNSVDELEKLISKLQELQEFLKSAEAASAGPSLRLRRVPQAVARPKEPAKSMKVSA